MILNSQGRQGLYVIGLILVRISIGSMYFGFGIPCFSKHIMSFRLRSSHDKVTHLEFQGFYLMESVALQIDSGSFTSLPDSYFLLGSFSDGFWTNESVI